MFVTGQNGVIKPKLVSSVDKSIKSLQLFLVSFGGVAAGLGGSRGSLGGCAMARWVWSTPCNDIILPLHLFSGGKPLGAVNAVNKPSSGSPPHPVYAPRRKRALSKPTRCYAPDGKHWLGNHEQKDWLAQEWGGCGGDLKLSDLCTPG